MNPKPILCSFCFFAAPYKSQPAEFIINGQAVCEDHVDRTRDDAFGAALVKLQDEQGIPR